MNGVYDIHIVSREREVTGYNLLMSARKSEEQVNLKSVLSHQYLEVSSDLLRIHASLCKVLHMSEAGEAIDRILDDIDSHDVLAMNGGDAELFSARLSM